MNVRRFLDGALLNARGGFLLATLLDARSTLLDARGTLLNARGALLDARGGLLLATLLDSALLHVQSAQQSSPLDADPRHEGLLLTAFLDVSFLLAPLLDVPFLLAPFLLAPFLNVPFLCGILLHPIVAAAQRTKQRERAGFRPRHVQANDQQGRQHNSTFHFRRLLRTSEDMVHNPVGAAHQ
jgi:hypothetical protein